MNDRGGYMLGKVFLVMALIMTAMGGALAWQWAKHEAVVAQAEYQRVLNAHLQAELEAQIPYMNAIEAEKARQLIARMQSEGLTAEVMDEVQRRQLLHEQAMQEAADAEKLAFHRSLHGVVASLLLTLGLAIILIPSVLITFVLFKKVGMNMSMDAQAEALARAREALSAQPSPQPVAPQPVAPRAEPATGRLPGLPQGQPLREQPRRPQPAVAQPQPVAGPVVLDRNAMHSYGPQPQPANGHVTSHNGNGSHPSRNGRGSRSNGVTGHH